MRAKNSFPYIKQAARKYGVDAVQVVNPRGTTFDRNKFIERLNAVDYAELAGVYREIGERDDAARISAWIESDDPIQRRGERRRAFLLFVLFKALGDERKIKPFSDGKVCLVEPPEPPADWSKLPQGLAWLAKPAEKYGIHQFPAEVDRFFSNIRPRERAELRQLKAKCEEHEEEIERFLSAHSKDREGELVSFFLDLLDDSDLNGD